MALATLTLWPLGARCGYGTAEERRRALIYLPVFGFMAGILLALLDRATGPALGLIGQSAVVIALSLLGSRGLPAIGLAHTAGALWRGSGPAAAPERVGPASALAGAAFVVSEVVVLGTIAAPASRARALILGNLLSRWAIVPVGYGLKPIGRSGLGVPWEGGITFREFALSSVWALGVAMVMYDVIALTAIVALAVTILGLRLVFSRRLGGVDGYALAGASALCELVAFAVLGAIRI